jgi:DNA-binding ferritin-like protein
MARTLAPSPLPYSDATRLAAIDVVDQLGLDVQAFRAGVYAAHHRIKGEHAVALHKFLGKMSAALDEYSDQLTEMVEMLGGESSGSAEEIADGTRLEPWPRGIVDGLALCDVIADRAKSLLLFFEAALADIDAMGAQVPFNRVLNIQEGLAVWAWKIMANLPLPEAEEPAPESDRAGRFMTQATAVHHDADGVLRV